ncbi:MAG: RDD family protein [Gemmatimonadota bacterium]
MSAIDRYVEDVTHRIAPGLPGRARLESDLRSHLRERVEAGEDEPAAVARMGGPQEVAAEFLEAADPPLASPGERLGAFLFDVGLGAVALAAIGALAAWVLAPRVAVGPEGLPVSVEVGLAAAAILLFVSGILYFPVFETLFGQTAGKRLFGTVVAKDSGERVGLGPAIVRRLPLLFDIWPFDAGFLLFTARRQRAFDLAAKTIVFRAEGRSPARPWLLVAVVWLVAAGLGLVIALAASGAGG